MINNPQKKFKNINVIDAIFFGLVTTLSCIASIIKANIVRILGTAYIDRIKHINEQNDFKVISPDNFFYTHILDFHAYKIIYNANGAIGIYVAICSIMINFTRDAVIALLKPVILLYAIVSVTINSGIKSAGSNLVVNIYDLIVYYITLPLIIAYYLATIIENCFDSITAQLSYVLFNRDTPEQGFVQLLIRKLKYNMINNTKQLRRDALIFGVSTHSLGKIVRILRLPKVFIDEFNFRCYTDLTDLNDAVARSIADINRCDGYELQSIGLHGIENTESVRIIAEAPKIFAALKELYIDSLYYPHGIGYGSFSGSTSVKEEESLRIIVDCLPINTSLIDLAVEIRTITDKVAICIKDIMEKSPLLDRFTLRWKNADQAGMQLISNTLATKKITQVSFTGGNQDDSLTAMQKMLETCYHINGLRAIEYSIPRDCDCASSVNDFCKLLQYNTTIQKAIVRHHHLKCLVPLINGTTRLKELHLKLLSDPGNHDDGGVLLEHALAGNLETGLNVLTCADSWVRTQKSINKIVDSINAERKELYICWKLLKKPGNMKSLPDDIINKIQEFIPLKPPFKLQLYPRS